MSAGCVRWLLSRTVRAVCDVNPGHWMSTSRATICGERSNATAFSWRWSLYSTSVGDPQQTPAPTKKKQNYKAQGTVGSIGRKIPHRLIHLISDTDESLGTMHRADVIKIMDEKGLKLVLLNDRKDPPVYKLMSGKQIHEEQMKLWKEEKQKAKAAPVQVRELTVSSGIMAHDLTTKLRQAKSWLEKKQHVKITARSGRGEPAGNLDTFLAQTVEKMGVRVEFVSKPKVIREGQAATCILRPLSAKELSKRGENKAAASPFTHTSPTDTSPTDTSPTDTSPTATSPTDTSLTATPNKSVSHTDTAEGSIQQ